MAPSGCHHDSGQQPVISQPVLMRWELVHIRDILVGGGDWNAA